MDKPAARDTIAAIATAAGAGAVGIVRLSGPLSGRIATEMFRSGRPGFAGLKPRRLHHGTLVDSSGRALDEVLAALMPGPGSFTGEDTAEFHCHGGPAVLRAVLDECLARGARLALPGEFSRRAFLGGKLDLAQAEAIAETIAAPTRAALHMAQLKLSGVLSRRIDALRERLDGLRAQLCLAVDFPDEDVECLPPAELRTGALEVVRGLDELLASVNRARVWREGALAVLAGRVNAGKSSLMNALVGRARALVSATPGTTRDYIEEPLDLGGLPVRLVDTAGLRSGRAAEGMDPVEAAGQELSRDFMSRAEAVLYVLDAAQPVHPDDRAALAELAERGVARALVVLNKLDLAFDRDEGAQAADEHGLAVIRVSARTGEGLEELCARLRELLLAGSAEPDPDEAAPNARQAASIASARADLLALADEVELGLPYDVLGVRLQAACVALEEITGRTAPQDVLDTIFSRFCIGK